MSERPRVPQAPRLCGTALRLAAGASRTPGAGALLARRVLGELRVFEFRTWPAEGALWFDPPGLRRAGERVGASPALREAKVSGGPGRASEALDYHRRFRDGALTPVGLAQALIDVLRADDAHPQPLRAFIQHSAADVLAAAAAAEERWRRGEPQGPLDGVPVAVKDEFDQAGYPTTAGAALREARPATEDAFVVERARGAGVVLLGKTNMHELGLGVTGVNPHHGAARNPHHREHITGGSSSGSAVVVAAGFAPIAFGADAGGSIRIPAALCGVVGLKPTFGRVSSRGAAPLCWSVGHAGPLAATVADAALGYALMAGADANDPRTHYQPDPSLARWREPEVRGLRVGVDEAWLRHADPAVADVFWGALLRLEARGARRVAIELRDFEALRTSHLVTIAAEMAAAQRSEWAQGLVLSAETRLHLALGERLTAADYVHAQRLRQRVCGALAAQWQAVDVIASPAVGMLAPRIAPDALSAGESHLAQTDALMAFAQPANLAGLPALSVPAGRAHGLPVGLQLMGPHWSEDLLLGLARWVEEDAEDLRLPRPAV